MKCRRVSFPPFWVCPPLFVTRVFLLYFFHLDVQISSRDVHNITTIKIFVVRRPPFWIGTKKKKKCSVWTRSTKWKRWTPFLRFFSRKRIKIPNKILFLSFFFYKKNTIVSHSWKVIELRVTANDTRTEFFTFLKKQNLTTTIADLVTLKKRKDDPFIVCEIICRVTQIHLRRIKKPRQVKEDKCPSLRVVASWFRVRSQVPPARLFIAYKTRWWIRSIRTAAGQARKVSRLIDRSFLLVGRADDGLSDPFNPI